MITKPECKMLSRFADVNAKNAFLSELPDVQKGRARNLCRLGLLMLLPDDSDNAFIAGTTPAGRHEIELYKEQCSRDRWTRALSIVAIIISILALFAQAMDLSLSELLRLL